MVTVSEPRLLASRPVLAAGGQDDASLADGLLNLMVAEDTAGLSRAEARFGNWGTLGSEIGFLYFDRRLLDFGKALQVRLGAGADSTIFDGRITGLEAAFPEGEAPSITVLAEDRFQDLRMTRRTRTFEQASDADVFNRIAADHGLSAGVDVSGPTYPVLAQVNQSDLAFMRERARSIDAELWMDGSTLHVQARGRRRGATVTLTYGGSLREFTVLADLAHQRTSASANGWDVAGKAPVSYEAADAALGGELNGDSSGASILASALGQRKEALVHTIPLSHEEARATAEAYFKLGARRFLVGHGTADPDPRLRVGATVDLQGLGPLFSGRYYLSAVQHLFDPMRGLRTEFTAERPGMGQVSA